MATYDFYVVMKTPDTIRNTQVFDFGGPKPVGIKGFYKTISQWVKCLLTEPGTDVSDSSYGTAFANLIGGNVGTPQDVSDVVTLAVQTATNTVQSYQRTSQPPLDERLATVKVTQLVQSTSQVDVYITLTNAANTAVTLTLPVGVRAPTPSPTT